MVESESRRASTRVSQGDELLFPMLYVGYRFNRTGSVAGVVEAAAGHAFDGGVVVRGSPSFDGAEQQQTAY